MSNTERHLAEFPVGSQVAIWNTLQRAYGREYTKAVVVRHTKTRIMVQHVDEAGQPIGSEYAYSADNLNRVGQSYRRHFNKIRPWSDSLVNH